MPQPKLHPRRLNGPQQGRTAKQMVVAVAREERDAYAAGAAQKGITLAAWARRELTAAAGRKLPANAGEDDRGVLRTSVGLRLSKVEWLAYRAEARRLGLSRNEWARRVLNRAASRPRSA